MASALTTTIRTATFSVVMLLVGCTDGATRIANDIQSGVSDFEHSDAQSFIVRHVPEKDPDGCSGAYSVQFSENSAIVIWCKDSQTGEITSSHTTTYHLNFVKVPKTYILEKRAGEPTLIELTKEGGAVVVTNIH